ncbi:MULTISPECIES: hypothetical protein [unclassified Fusibacter]|uniref:hypothetical protein n=1 Tax=unclassified Fusibacter TaxID=2624464 RepID=UPI001010670A|nr:MULTISPECIES: hypothetical protein [unclassified Fusibacter]MCK8059983.1 hypothetical protein [Fusibacter sp. A2]NPE22123.1 hypothetical protein [Fusibacter sp. A1]RXV60901.1 hypothetical protein DWB64_09775 [Fusibacter sp. A1]
MIKIGNLIDLKRNSIEKKLIVFLMLIVFIVHVSNFFDLSIFSVLDDEFGYWGNAAYFAGYDWSNTISEIPFYSYGYSLILTPLFLIFKSPIIMYRAAIILNGIMMSISFLLCYAILKKMTMNVDNILLAFVSVFIVMYPTYIVYSSIAWSESLLIMSCWLLAWCFAVLDEQSGNFKFMFIGFLSAFIYVVHQRTLGIVIASVMVVLMMTLTKRIKLKQLMIVVLIIMIILIADVYMKNNLKDNLWSYDNGNLTNDYSSQVVKIEKIFTMKGIFEFFGVLGGHLFYVGASSYLLSYFGLFELLQSVVKKVSNAIRTKEFSMKYNGNVFDVHLFLLMAFGLTILINSIFMINPIRIDHIVYGRYIDVLNGELILFGFARLLKGKSELSHWFYTVILVFIVGFGIAAYSIGSSNLTSFHIVQSVGVFSYSRKFGLVFPALIAILVSRFIFLTFSNESKKMMTVCLIFITVIGVIIGKSLVYKIVEINQSTMEIVKIVEILETTDKKIPIFFLWNDQIDPNYEKWDNKNTVTRLIVDCYQFLLMDRSVYLVNAEELASITEDKYIITTGSLVDSGKLDEYEYCYSSFNNYLYRSLSK